MPELSATLLLSQLSRFMANHKKRNDNATYLERKLNAIPGIECQKKLHDVNEASYYTFNFRIDAKGLGAGRDEVIKALNEKGIPATAMTPPLHQLGMFKFKRLPKGIDFSSANWGGDKSEGKSTVFIPVLTRLADRFFMNSATVQNTAISIPHPVSACCSHCAVTNRFQRFCWAAKACWTL